MCGVQAVVREAAEDAIAESERPFVVIREDSGRTAPQRIARRVSFPRGAVGRVEPFDESFAVGIGDNEPPRSPRPAVVLAEDFDVPNDEAVVDGGLDDADAGVIRRLVHGEALDSKVRSGVVVHAHSEESVVSVAVVVEVVVARGDEFRVVPGHPEVVEAGETELVVHVIPSGWEIEERIVVRVFLKNGCDRLVSVVVRPDVRYVNDRIVLVFVIRFARRSRPHDSGRRRDCSGELEICSSTRNASILPV
ncbi:hypothetical protein [Haladaptatus sp. W1]|uniref:hypothetical protein n=1 Tax=Haladaptatus sp. W1 TaxID=1897478 RepID=UPI0020C7B8D3|nr:hypothetical protein [Haladaptatus sp. W1]